MSVKVRKSAGRALAELALAELGRLARLVQTGLLALDLAGIARQEALPLQRHAPLPVRLDARARDPAADGPRLAREAAAVHADSEVVLALEARHLQRRRCERPPDVARE